MKDQPRRVVGHGATKTPRGMLYPPLRARHDGTILDTRIVPPTSPNQLVIEEDLRAFAQRNVELPDEALRLRYEQAIPNHDPCISCATHLLELTVQRG